MKPRSHLSSHSPSSDRPSTSTSSRVDSPNELEYARSRTTSAPSSRSSPTTIKTDRRTQLPSLSRNTLTLTPTKSTTRITHKVEPVEESLPELSTSKYLICWNNALQGQFHPQKRRAHTCVAYRSSMILYGGYAGQVVGDMWFLDTVKLRWFRYEAEPGVPTPDKRCGHSAVLLQDSMYVFGGDTGVRCCNELWSFHIPTKAWTKVQFSASDKQPAGRYGHAVVAYGHVMIMYGGADRFSSHFSDVWVFDSLHKKWSFVEAHSTVPPSRHGHSLTLVGDSVYMFGGHGEGGRMNDCWRLDPVTLVWYSINQPGPRPSRRSTHSAVPLAHKLLVFGGQSAAACSDLWEFDTSTCVWKRLELSKTPQKVALAGNLLGPSARSGHSACVFRGVRMFIYGGISDGNAYCEDLWYLFVDPTMEGLQDVNSGLPSLPNDTPPPSADQHKMWKSMHEQLLSLVQGVQSDWAAKQKQLEERDTTVKTEAEAASVVARQQDDRIAHLEKRWRRLKLLYDPEARTKIAILQQQVSKHDTEIEQQQQQVGEQEKAVQVLESAMLELDNNLRKEVGRVQEDTQQELLQASQLRASLQEDFEQFKLTSELVQKALEDVQESTAQTARQVKAHYKKLKQNTETSLSKMKQEMAELHAKLESAQNAWIETSRMEAERAQAELKSSLGVERAEDRQRIERLQQQIRDLDLRTQEQSTDFIRFVEAQGKEQANTDKEIQQRLTAANQTLRAEMTNIEQSLQLDLQRRESAANAWVQSKVDEMTKEFSRQLGQQQQALQQEQAQRAQLELQLTETRKQLEANIIASVRHLEQSTAPQLAETEKKLADIERSLRKLEPEVYREVERKVQASDEQRAKAMQEVRESLRNQLRRIAEDVQALVQAIVGKDESEEVQLDYFRQRLELSMTSTASLQQVLSDVLQ